jgi:hypothetical protein
MTTSRHSHRQASAAQSTLLTTLLTLLFVAGLTGCVRRVYEVPGMPPGSDLAVGSDMRMEKFEVDEFEVQPFRIPLTGTNRRRYQFAVLKDGIEQMNYMVERTEEGVWSLVEARPDGISITRTTWPEEPSYAVVRAAVVNLLKGGK